MNSLGLSLPALINVALYYDIQIVKLLSKELLIWVNVILLVLFTCSFLLLVNTKSALTSVVFATVTVLGGIIIVFADAIKQVQFTIFGIPCYLIAFITMFIFVTFSEREITNAVILSSNVRNDELTFDVYDIFSYSVTTLVLLQINILWKKITHPKALTAIHARVYLEEPIGEMNVV